ncbi:DUF1850 domain-containing protein [Nitratireductor pacificus]|uniref:DUF1850 domain-containing protein n=1 Tax=Nitratireductor pacificus pht-3B TaxID=391937 RepID=K2MKF6_9HYPH|nr:DUF1850 domain-containing protein [Nitratireductor pacificus]EKF17717.1 hypothetical protein NA2_16697 [Nitratireductor pacificus pht-3B]
MITIQRRRHGILLSAMAALVWACIEATAGQPSGERAADCGWWLDMVRPRSGAPLMRVPLEADRPRFALTYTHSVFRTPVESRYRIVAGAIVQDAEVYTDPGYGMESTTDDPTQRLERIDGHLQLALERPIANLVVRVQAAQNNRLIALEPVDLGQRFGDGPIALRPVRFCPR